MARSSAGGPGHAGLILILLGLATASCGYIVGVVAAWARCGDAAVAPHCADAGNATIYSGLGLAAALLAAGSGLMVRGRRTPGRGASQAPVARHESARVSARFWAGVIDLVVLWLISLPLTLSPIAAFSGPQTSFPALSAVYFGVSWAWGGRSPGMALLAIRVVSAAETTRDRLRLWQIAARLLLYIPSLCLGGLPFLAVILDGQRRALHDRLARTRVVTGAS